MWKKGSVLESDGSSVGEISPTSAQTLSFHSVCGMSFIRRLALAF